MDSLVVVGACAARATLRRRGQVSPHARLDLWVCHTTYYQCYQLASNAHTTNTD